MKNLVAAAVNLLFQSNFVGHFLLTNLLLGAQVLMIKPIGPTTVNH
jgi:hypothetical protein